LLRGGCCAPECVDFGAEFGEPVFVAGALVGQPGPGVGVGAFVVDSLPGGGQFDGRVGVRGAGVCGLLLRGVGAGRVDRRRR